jgi:hypothetical protein
MTPMPRTLSAISIRQPWAGLIVLGIKGVENRSWKCPERYIGREVLIQAGLRPDDGISRGESGWEHDIQGAARDIAEEAGFLAPLYRAQWERPRDFVDAFLLGHVVGAVTITGCVRDSDFPWAMPGQWHWRLANARTIKPFPCKGRLGFFNVEPPEGWPDV